MSLPVFKSICIPALSAKASIYEVPLEKTSAIISFFIANMSNTMNTTSVQIRRSGTDISLVSSVPISVGTTIDPTNGRKVFLIAGDMLYVQAEYNVDIILSIIEGIS